MMYLKREVEGERVGRRGMLCEGEIERMVRAGEDAVAEVSDVGLRVGSRLEGGLRVGCQSD